MDTLTHQNKIPMAGCSVGHVLALLLAFWLLLTSPVLAQKNGPSPQEQKASGSSGSRQNTGEISSPIERDLTVERERWFNEQRAYPRKAVPAGALLRAQRRAEEMRKAQQERLAKSQGSEIEALIQANGTAWTPLGPGPASSLRFGLTSGRVTALAVDPTDPNIVYAGAAQGGVWKSTNGGGNWTPLTDDQPTLAIGSIAIDPSSCAPAPCKTIYVGTGEQNFSADSYYGAGILKSTDGGATWTQIGQSAFVGPFSSGFSPGGGARIGSLTVNSQGVVLAGVAIDIPGRGGSASGIYQSRDGGQTWANVLGGAAGTEVFFHPTNPNIAFAALGSPNGDTDNGVYISRQSGDVNSWNRIDAASSIKLPTNNVGRIEIAIAPSQPNTMYAAIQDATSKSLLDFFRSPTGSVSQNGFFKSTDGGVNWTVLPNTPNFCEGHCDTNLVIRVHPDNPDVVYAGGARGTCPVPLTLSGACPVAPKNYLIRSADGGATWTEIIDTTAQNVATVVHWDECAMSFGGAVSGRQIYLGNGGGVWSADISNATGPVAWTDLNNDLQIAQIYPGLSIHPSDEQTTFAGTQDNGTHSFTGTLPWNQITCDHGGYTAIDPNLPSTIYAACAGSVDIRKSFRDGDRGAGPPFVNSSWISGFTRGISKSEPVNFIAPLVFDPNVAGRLYFGTNRIYQSSDDAQTWVALGSLPSVTGTVRAIVPAPSDSQTVYVGTSTGLLYRTDTADNIATPLWLPLSTFGLPQRALTSLAIHPANKEIVFVTFSGFYSFPGSDPQNQFFVDETRHVFRSIDGGATWDDISGVGTGALPNAPVNALVIDPAPPTGVVGDTLYIGTDVGVFVTTDGGVNWAPVTGLPNAAVLGLTLRNVSRTLRASTHGRGVWDLQLPGLPSYTLTGVSPPNLAIGQPATLNVRGQGFVPGLSQIEWNGSAQGTTCTTTRNCSATIPSALLNGVPAQITVITPVAGRTNALMVTVQNPVPVLHSISPTTVAPSNQGQPLTVNGSSFVPGSVVQVDGNTIPTLFVSGTQIAATILPSTTQVAGVYEITVANPAPGGGVNIESQNQTFTVTGSGPTNDAFSAAVNVTFQILNGIPQPFADGQNTGNATANTGGVADPAVPSSCATGLAAQNHSIWYKFTPTSAGEITADTFGSVYNTVLTVVTGSPGAFTVVACDDDLPNQFQTQSQVIFLATASTTYYFMVTDAAGTGGTTVFNLRFAVTPRNDNLTAAVVVTGTGPTIDFTDAEDTSAATIELTDPKPSCAASLPGVVSQGRARSVWYRYVPGASGSVTADTLNSRYDTVLSVFQGVPGSFTEAGCNDDVQPGNLRSLLSLNVSANATYFFMITAFNGTGGPLTFHLAGPGTVADFTADMNVNSLTVTRGATPATATITVTPTNGSLAGTISFACQNLPLEATCTFSPQSVTLGSGSQTTTLSVSAAAPSNLPPPLAPPTPWPLLWLAASVLLLAVLMRRARLGYALALVALFSCLILFVSCGGSNNGPSSLGTPPGNYTVNVTATSSSGNFVRSTSFVLTVR